MNEEYKKLIDRLNANVQMVIQLYNEQKRNNIELSERLDNVNKELNHYKENYQEIEKKYNDLKMANLVVKDVGDKDGAVSKLNSIIREIEKCIALLNN